MIARLAFLVASFLATAPAMAQSMNAEAAQRFVSGDYFAFSCFEGSRGVGRIAKDGSVPMRAMRLPPGTLKVKGDAVCASLQPNRRAKLSGVPPRAGPHRAL
jgi:hypothetical protein